MARYAEWNKFIGNLKTDKYGNTTVNEVGIAFEKATADVVPKSEVEALEREIARLKKSALPSYFQAVSEEEAIKIGKEYGRAEVAREIFEEIESIIRKHDERPKYQLMLDIAELKNKYTGDPDDIT